MGKGKVANRANPGDLCGYWEMDARVRPGTNGYNESSILIGGIKLYGLFRIQIHYSTALGEVKSKIRRDEQQQTCILTRNGDFSDRKTMAKRGISTAEYYSIKRSAYQKFIRAFGTDEQVDRLDTVYVHD